MSLLPSIGIALRALAKNKMRGALTVLGVVIGVGAVTTLVSVGQSASKVVQESLQKEFGTDVIIANSSSKREGGVQGGPGGTPTLTVDDATAIKEQCGNLLMAVTPIVGVQKRVIRGSSNWHPKELLGVDTDYAVVRNWDTRLGGFFTDSEIRSRANVCVIGQTLVENLFADHPNPINQEIRIENLPFRVIGVLRPKGTDVTGKDYDDLLLAPYSTVRARLRGSTSEKIDAIFCKVRNPERMGEAREQMDQLLKEKHKIGAHDARDFELLTSSEIGNLVTMITGILTALLASIAGVSLVVGGVGIMNIMLVSVTERTREIGIRMAVGAHEKDIMRQFLVEAMMLSTAGGLVGLLLGIGASLGLISLINAFKPSGDALPIIVSLRAAIVAISFAVAIGVFFGYYPARRASRLDPIDALRYE